MLRPQIQEDSEEEEGKFAQRRAKALGADMKTIAKGEADKVAHRVIEEHLATVDSQGLRLGSLRKHASEADVSAAVFHKKDCGLITEAHLTVPDPAGYKAPSPRSDQTRSFKGPSGTLRSDPRRTFDPPIQFERPLRYVHECLLA